MTASYKEYYSATEKIDYSTSKTQKSLPYFTGIVIILAIMPVLIINLFRKRGETKNWVKVVSFISISLFTFGSIALGIIASAGSYKEIVLAILK